MDESVKNEKGHQKKKKSTNNDSEEELDPPSPIQLGPEEAYSPGFEFPDPRDIRRMDAETQSRLKAFLDVAGVKLSHVDERTFQDPEILRKLTNR